MQITQRSLWVPLSGKARFFDAILRILSERISLVVRLCCLPFVGDTHRSNHTNNQHYDRLLCSKVQVSYSYCMYHHIGAIIHWTLPGQQSVCLAGCAIQLKFIWAPRRHSQTDFKLMIHFRNFIITGASWTICHVWRLDGVPLTSLPLCLPP